MLSKRFLAAVSITICALGASLGSFPVSTAHADELPAAVHQEIKILQTTWATNPVVINAIKEQNAKNVSLTEIKKLDESWRSTSGLGAFMIPYLDNPAAEELARLEETAGYVQESFAMDNQGGLVAATTKTSDYWQGDEAKFIESFKDGKGAVHVGEIEFDNSAQAYLVQVSIPVMDGGKAIGAITIGIDVDKVQ